jgi:hypothetical protein
MSIIDVVLHGYSYHLVTMKWNQGNISVYGSQPFIAHLNVSLQKIIFLPYSLFKLQKTTRRMNILHKMRMWIKNQ